MSARRRNVAYLLWALVLVGLVLMALLMSGTARKLAECEAKGGASVQSNTGYLCLDKRALL